MYLSRIFTRRYNHYPIEYKLIYCIYILTELQKICTIYLTLFLGRYSGCNEYTNFIDMLVSYVIFSAAFTRHSFIAKSKL